MAKDCVSACLDGGGGGRGGEPISLMRVLKRESATRGGGEGVRRAKVWTLGRFLYFVKR